MTFKLMSTPYYANYKLKKNIGELIFQPWYA